MPRALADSPSFPVSRSSRVGKFLEPVVFEIKDSRVACLNRVHDGFRGRLVPAKPGPKNHKAFGLTGRGHLLLDKVRKEFKPAAALEGLVGDSSQLKVGQSNSEL